ncbi:MAG TPA: alpha/beta fold hydrolase [Acidobacteriaceae bacterium]|nr:alpha/beta fold hydrolase [Acidobacteriaceae bacterium]
MAKAAHIPSKSPVGTPTGAPVTVSGRWLLIAFLLSLGAALLCGYGTLCLLFWQGQWQLLYHPSRTVTTTPASEGLAFDDIHFDVTDEGRPQLDGWWISAGPNSAWPGATVLYLHGASGSLSDTVPELARLHALGLNVFAFDYRGFGRSESAHPTERMANADADAAWKYLTDARGIPARSLLVWGDGVGATFAAHLAAEFAPAGVILQDPNPPARQILLADARARILPLSLLQNETLDPTAELQFAHVPRLFLDRDDRSDRTHHLFLISGYPKDYFDLRGASDDKLSANLRRFLDEILH